MTRFNSEDHNSALRACWDADAFGAKIDDADLVALNRAASAYACNEPETLTRAAFSAALARVNAQIEAAKTVDPARAAAVVLERDAKRLAAMTKDQIAYAEKAKAAKTQAARREAYFYAASALPHEEYSALPALCVQSMKQFRRKFAQNCKPLLAQRLVRTTSLLLWQLCNDRKEL